MVPIRGALEKLATDLGKTYSDYNKLCEDNDIVQAVVKTLGIHGIKSNLEKFEIPRNFTLSPEVGVWVETGFSPLLRRGPRSQASSQRRSKSRGKLSRHSSSRA